MENASKALLIAGAILIAILLIAIAMYVYSTSQGNVNQAMASLDVQQIQSLNQAWLNYEGKQTGSQVKSLINRLVANANNYREEPEKVVGITSCEATPGANNTANWTIPTNGSADSEINDLIDDLNDVSAAIQARHVYWVEAQYAANGLIVSFDIAYDIP